MIMCYNKTRANTTTLYYIIEGVFLLPNDSDRGFSCKLGTTIGKTWGIHGSFSSIMRVQQLATMRERKRMGAVEGRIKMLVKERVS